MSPPLPHKAPSASAPTQRWRTWGAGATLVLAAVLKQPVRFDDISRQYIEGAVYRPPLLPLLFRLLGGLLPPWAALRAFDGLQAAVALATCTALARTLGRRLGLGAGATAFLWAVLSLPQWTATTSVMSESLAYSLLLACVAGAVPLLWGERSPGGLLLMTGAAALLVLTRSQFAYVVPAVVVAFAVGAARERDWAARAKVAAAGLGVVLTALTLQAAHTVPQIGRLGGGSSTGSQLLALATAAASPDDVAAIADADAHDFAARVWEETRQAQQLTSQAEGTVPELFASLHYNDILVRVMGDFADGYAPKEVARGFDALAWLERGTGPAAPAWASMNDLFGRAARPMLRREAGRLLVQQAKTVLLWERAMTLLVAGLVAVSALRARRSAEMRLLLMLSLGWLANVAFVVTFLGKLDLRYTFYFDDLVVALVLALVCRGAATTRAAAP